MLKDLPGKGKADLFSHGTLEAIHFRYDIPIAGWVDDDSLILEILSGGSEHRGPADVNLLERLIERYAVPGDGSLKRIQIDDNKIDRGDVEFGKLLAVGRIFRDCKEPRVDLRMERLYTAIENLGEPRHV